MRLPRVHLDQLITFYLVATEKSFTSAAEKLCVTQPAVTMQLRELEKAYGVKLVHVKRKRVCLTAEAELLLPHAEELYRAALRAEELLEHHGRAKTLRIGLVPALAGYAFPVISVFSELYPTVRVVVREGSSHGLVEAVRDFQHDLCFVASLSARPGDVEVYRLRHAERMVLVSIPGSTLAEKAAVDWEDLAGQPLILHGEGSAARAIVLEEFRKRGITPQIAAEVDNVSYVKQLIERRGAVALMFSPNVEEEVAQQKLTVLPWAGGEIQIGIDVVLRREGEVSPSCAAFLDVLAKHFGEDFGRGR
ncbi:MAG: LysR family transcriptional regulator [Deltaproteobacteria bacterium]|nr:LysR family transcriptional regulator [Deltaproteobacteria bacterium]